MMWNAYIDLSLVSVLSSFSLSFAFYLARSLLLLLAQLTSLFHVFHTSPHLEISRVLRLRRNIHCRNYASFDVPFCRASLGHLGKGWIARGTIILVVGCDLAQNTINNDTTSKTRLLRHDTSNVDSGLIKTVRLFHFCVSCHIRLSARANFGES